MRVPLNAVPGIRLFMFAAQDVRAGGRQSDSDYQFTLVSPDVELLQKWAPLVVKKLEGVEGVSEVSSDRDPGGLQLTVSIDRMAAARLGVRVQDVETALNNAFTQRQISTIYTQRNQYKVVLEIASALQSDPEDLSHIFVPGANSAQVPLSAVVRMERTLAPLWIYSAEPDPLDYSVVRHARRRPAADARWYASATRSKNFTCPKAFAVRLKAMRAISAAAPRASRC